jgi:hypothetical protein
LGLVACGAERTPSAPIPSQTPVVRNLHSCDNLKPGSPTAQCHRAVPLLQAEVDGAIRLLAKQKPDLFDGNQVLRPSLYFTGVIETLDAAGVCGFWTGGSLGVRNADSFSEQYDIMTPSRLILMGPKNYVATCTPPEFPL